MIEAHPSIPSISTKETTIMSLVKYFFACMVFCTCSVVATITTAIDAAVRCSTVLYQGHVRLFIHLYYHSELQGTQYQQINKTWHNWKDATMRKRKSFKFCVTYCLWDPVR